MSFKVIIIKINKFIISDGLWLIGGKYKNISNIFLLVPQPVNSYQVQYYDENWESCIGLFELGFAFVSYPM